MSKVAIVTAASMGMGKACAIELVQSGYKVVIMSRSEQILEVAKEIGADGVQGSITCKEDIKALVDLAMDKYGRIDAVVNNAGYIPKGEFFELSDENWHEGLDIVIGSVNTMLKLTTPIFQSQGGGSVVNISTFAAFEPSPVFPISTCMRAALGSYIKLYADKYAKDNIRINNVLPGFVDSKPVHEKFLKDIPMGRYGKVEEIAKTVRFLLSDDGSIRIFLNKKVMKESMDYIISDVIAHEYAHALLFKIGAYKNKGDGHSALWQKTCVKLGGAKCAKYVNSHDVIMQKLPF